MTVHNRDVLEWMCKRNKQAEVIGEKVEKVRVCHRCLYGLEYNRKNEQDYLSWIKAESLTHSEGYKNFRSQPDKQKVIDDYAAGQPSSREVNGVDIISAAVPAGLGALAGQYKKCTVCNKLPKMCQCQGPRAWRAGEMTPRGVAEPGEGTGGAGDAPVGGFTYGRSGSGGSGGGKSNMVSEYSSSDDETDPNTETWNDHSINESERIDPGAGAGAGVGAGAGLVAGAGYLGDRLPDEVVRLVRAWADFVSDGDVQLTLAEGDVIQVLHEANEDGWGYGRSMYSTKDGYFPMSHVEEVAGAQAHAAASSAAASSMSSAREEGACDAPSPQMLEPLVAGQHRCAPWSRGADASDVDHVELEKLKRHFAKTEAKIDAEAKIRQKQQMWEEELKRRTPNDVNTAGSTNISQFKNFCSWASGKTPQAQQAVANYAPLEIRHIGAGVQLASALEAAAKALSAQTSTSSHTADERLRQWQEEAAQPASPAHSAGSPPPLPPSPPPPAVGSLPKLPLGAISHAPPHPPLPPQPVPHQSAAVTEWSCIACTLRNRGGAAACEACGTAKGDQMHAGTVIEQQRLQEQQAMRERLPGIQGIAGATPAGMCGGLGAGGQRQQIGAVTGEGWTHFDGGASSSPHNTMVQPPTVGIHQAPSPPKGDPTDSPGARALMNAGSPGSVASVGQQRHSNDKVLSAVALNMAQLMGESPTKSVEGGGGGGRGGRGGAALWSQAAQSLGLVSREVPSTPSATCNNNLVNNEHQHHHQQRQPQQQQFQPQRPGSATRKKPPPPPPRPKQV